MLQGHHLFRPSSRPSLVLTLMLVVMLAVAACSSPSPQTTAENTAEESAQAEDQMGEPSQAGAPANEYVAQREQCTLETPCLPTVVDTVPSTFNEAPMLSELVESGDLPPVEERLPKQPLVIQPAEVIGEYSDTWYRAFTGPGDRQNIERLTYSTPARWNTSVTEVVPYILRDWEPNEDTSEWTLYLREGMKWSDGEPFTTADYMFWYEHMLQNEQLVTAIPWRYTVGGELVKFEAVDDYTLKLTFAAPFPSFEHELAGGFGFGGQWTHGDTGLGMVAPAHYLSQFHADFIGEEEANAKAIEAGYENWHLYLLALNNPHMNPDLPVLSAWKPVTRISSNQYILERNPYFFAVDPEGNQLPYFDRIVLELVEELEVLNLRAIAGNYTIQGRHIDFTKLPVIRENEAQGGYFVDFWSSRNRSAITIYFNMDWDADPVLRELIHTREFRRVLSIAIERDEINEVFFLGAGTPSSFCPAGTSPYFPDDRWDKEWGQFDPEEANRLLDEIGLTERDSQGYRLLPNGEELTLNIDAVSGSFLDYPSASEMLSRMWADVGIRLEVNPVERSLWVERLEGNQTMLSIFDPGTWHPNVEERLTGSDRSFPIGVTWAAQTDRDPDAYNGPEWYKEMVELHFKGRAATDPQEADEYYLQGTEIFCDNQPMLGTVSDVPVWTVLIDNNVRNVPKPLEWVVFAQTPGNGFPETWSLVTD